MDSSEASKQMDYIYKNVTESLYIPGENFSFWGVPYLLGKGIDMKSIKRILLDIRKYILNENNIDVQEKMIREIQLILSKHSIPN